MSQHKTVLEFMQQVTRDEEANNTFAHKSFFRVIDRLRDPLSADDTRMFAIGGPMSMLEMLTRMNNGLMITGFLAGDKRRVRLGFA